MLDTAIEAQNPIEFNGDKMTTEPIPVATRRVSRM